MVRIESRAARGFQSLHFLILLQEGRVLGSVENRFHLNAVNGILFRDKFGPSIGMESKEFAEELFDTMARRKKINAENRITIEELEILGRYINSMCDKNGDGKLSEEEVKEVLVMSAAANKLTNFKKHAATYAALIMEEFDPDHLGYIEIWQLESLLRGMDYMDQKMGKRT
ncbi:hypothetical protein HAX54_002206 [Datura stramonium]|uniref:EF-hand domain-containing protein n=1 Tax=Datura stramonium TaxID=4076 RepID=A0ABS8RT98_DATST|nr:hypothetical protein [Datura stramonium]